MKKTNRQLKILHISDWHCGAERFRERLESRLEEVKDVDLVVVTGDMVPNLAAPWQWNFLENEERKFQREVWLDQADVLSKKLKGRPIIAVPGNHDFCDYGVDGLVRSFDQDEPDSFNMMGLRITGFRGVEYLEGFWDREYSDRALEVAVELLDTEADLLITHCPPRRILDTVYRGYNVGVSHLREFAINKATRLKVHFFGHIHERGGKILKMNNTFFSNAAQHLNVLTIEVE